MRFYFAVLVYRVLILDVIRNFNILAFIFMFSECMERKCKPGPMANGLAVGCS